MPRYVVLEHATPAGYRGLEAGVHWDFMLEHDGVLLTWSLEEQPNLNRPILAQQLLDHRLAYLEFEGPLSGDRGTVRRVAAGEFTWLTQSADHVAVELLRAPGELQRCRIERMPNGSWLARFEPLAS